MKIEVTFTWVVGNTSETTIAAVDMQPLEKIDAEQIGEIVHAIKQAVWQAQEGDPQKVSVSVDGEKPDGDK